MRVLFGTSNYDVPQCNLQQKGATIFENNPCVHIAIPRRPAKNVEDFAVDSLDTKP